MNMEQNRDIAASSSDAPAVENGTRRESAFLPSLLFLLILLIVTVVWGLIAVKLAPGHLGHGVVPELSVHPQAIRNRQAISATRPNQLAAA